MSKELYTYKCQHCLKTFRTPNPEQRFCPDCSRPKQTKKHKPLTFAEISHIAEVYNKIHHRYLHYGEVVGLISLNPKKCICCGAKIGYNRKPICDECNKVGEQI